MQTPFLVGRQVTATVDQILPRFGLAWAVDDHHMCFGITGLSTGVRPGSLSPGARVRLTLAEHDGARVVTAWAPLDESTQA